MGTPKRILVAGGDPEFGRLLAEALAPPEFEVRLFLDPAAAAAEIVEARPDLVLAAVPLKEEAGHRLLKALRNADPLARTGYVVLMPADSVEAVVSTLEGGADDVLMQPFRPRHVLAKVRAMLRMTDRAARLDRRGRALSGRVGDAGTLPLVKLCEEIRLSGRLTVESAGVTRSVAFRGGDLAPGDGVGEEPLDALLAITEGAYLIEQESLPVLVQREMEARIGPAADEPPASTPTPQISMPAGRLSMIELRGDNLQVQTEATNRPLFTVTTIILRAGKVVRKVEKSWQHALRRHEDRPLAQSQVDIQHDRVVSRLREMALAERGAPMPDEALAASLLSWAMHFLIEQVWPYLGTAVTLSVLRKSHARVARGSAALEAFQVTDEARVGVDVSRLLGATEALVEAVAGWAAAFLGEAGKVTARAGRHAIRDSTSMMSAALESIGFYVAFDAAWKRTQGGDFPGAPPGDSPD